MPYTTKSKKPYRKQGWKPYKKKSFIVPTKKNVPTKHDCWLDGTFRVDPETGKFEHIKNCKEYLLKYSCEL